MATGDPKWYDGNGQNRAQAWRLIQAIAVPLAIAAVISLAAGWGRVVQTMTVQEQQLKHQSERIDETVKRIERLETSIECIRASLQSLDRGQAVILEKLSRMVGTEPSSFSFMEDRTYESVLCILSDTVAGGHAGGGVGVRGADPEGVHADGRQRRGDRPGQRAAVQRAHVGPGVRADGQRLRLRAGGQQPGTVRGFRAGREPVIDRPADRDRRTPERGVTATDGHGWRAGRWTANDSTKR